MKYMVRKYILPSGQIQEYVPWKQKPKLGLRFIYHYACKFSKEVEVVEIVLGNLEKYKSAYDEYTYIDEVLIEETNNNV